MGHGDGRSVRSASVLHLIAQAALTCKSLHASPDRDSGPQMQGQTTDADPDDHRIKLFYFVFVDLMRKSTAHSYMSAFLV